MQRILERLALALVLAVAVLTATVAAAETSPLTLSGPVAKEGLAGHVAYIRDPGGDLDIADVTSGTRSGDWSPVGGFETDFGYTHDVVWLRVPLRNATEANADWRLHVHENFYSGFAVWILRPGAAPQKLEDLGPTSGFAERDIPYPELAVAFRLPPGETATLLIRYYSGGSSELVMSIETADSFAAKTAPRVAKNFIYYGMMLLLCVAALISYAASRHAAFLAYAVYAALGLLFIMHEDGNAFQYIWPFAARFNGWASVPLGGGLIAAGATFARIFLRTPQLHPRLDRMLIAATAVPVALILASLVLDSQIIKKLLVLDATLSITLFTACGLVAARTRFREVRFFVLAWAGAILSSGLMTARDWFGVSISAEVQFDSMRIVFVVDALLMGIAIVDRINMMRTGRQAALEASLTQAKQSLDLSMRLQELEDRYRLAMEMAETQERRIADALHDLRQPLHALRLNVHALSDRGAETPVRSDVEHTFEYLESLVNRELSARTENALRIARSRDQAPRAAPAEPLCDADRVCDSLRIMFASEAEAKGLRFDVLSGGMTLAMPSLVFSRILSNLVANAVKYTPEGRVLVGFRRGGPLGPRVEVHDTGPGMDEAAFAAALGRHRRFDSVEEGHGLGLDIVSTLARQHGLRVGLVPGRRGGTGIYVTLPLAGRRAVAPRLKIVGAGPELG